MPSRPLRVAFIHPDLGIGGAERLVVDAALGLQELGHSVDIYTSHHDPNHCFDETRDGSLRVYNITSPFPRSWKGKFHILFAHARQLHLTHNILRSSTLQYDVFFVDQLSTCIPFLKAFSKKRVVFYCHFPDKLLANGEFVEGTTAKRRVGLLKRLYRLPMDWWEEVTTRQADIILANSNFTARVFNSQFPSIRQRPKVVYPGINVAAYETSPDLSDPDIVQVVAEGRSTFLSLNRFEKKKNAALAIDSFAHLHSKLPNHSKVKNSRLVIAGGYDPRLEDNILTLASLIDRAKAQSLTYDIKSPSSSRTTIPLFNTTTKINPDIIFLLNFTTSQRTALLSSSSTVVLLYTPTNEHFGIGPVEGMLCGLPVLACNSGGPMESIISQPPGERTGWLCPPVPILWADALVEIVELPERDREWLRRRAKQRARELFGMEVMAKGLEGALNEAVVMGPVRKPNWLFVYILLTFLVIVPGLWLMMTSFR